MSPLYTLHSCHIDTVEIDIVRDVTIEFLTVDQDQNIFVAQTVEAQEGSHRVGCHRYLGHHTDKGTVEGADTLFTDLLGREYMHRGGSAFQTLVMA